MEEALAVGETGEVSIRLGGLRIEDLPWWIQERLKPQLEMARNQELKQKALDILAKYPDQRADYLKARIDEAKKNSKLIAQQADKERTTIQEYTALIAQCEIRDEELAKTSDPDEQKAIKKRFPPWNVEAMHRQIFQCEQSIERCEAVIKQEQAAIEKLFEVRALCQQRDADLRAIGIHLTAW
jgi:hypothetical protein